jgi:mannose-6-phosphate isomerase-like protein (cupin superfamily)
VNSIEFMDGRVMETRPRYTDETLRAMDEGEYILEAKEREIGRNVAYFPPGEGNRSLRVFGELVMYKIKSEQTGGAYSLFEVTTQPGEGAPSHVQHREDESFYLLEGEYEFLVEGRTLKVGKGSLLYIPKGTLHAYKNVGEDVGRMLSSQTPGGLYERFFEEVGKPVNGNGGPLIIEDQPVLASNIVAIAAKYGIEIPPPEEPETRNP